MTIVNDGPIAIPIAGNGGGVAGMQEWTVVSSFTRVSDTSFTVTDDSANQAIFKEGRPIRYKATAGTLRYGIVVDYTTGTVTLAGAPLTTSDDDEMEWGGMNRLQSMSFSINGSFADATDNTLIENDLNASVKWPFGEGYLVRFSHIVKTDDSGATQPGINVFLRGVSNLLSSNDKVAETWQDSTVVLNTTYQVALDDAIDIKTDSLGTNDDAKDLSVILTFVTA